MTANRCSITCTRITTVLALSATIIVFAATSTSADASASEPRMNVSVYYEALCPDSIYFIRQSLYDSMLLNNRLQYTNLHFVPYGKVVSWTDRKNVTKLYCQHGSAECERNALHACIVEHNTVEEQLKMINCLLGGSDVDKCSTDLQIDVAAAKQCKSSRTIADILHKAGLETDPLDLTFVPTVTFNGEFKRQWERYVMYNFGKVFCQKYKTYYKITLSGC